MTDEGLHLIESTNQAAAYLNMHISETKDSLMIIKSYFKTIQHSRFTLCQHFPG